MFDPCKRIYEFCLAHGSQKVEKIHLPLCQHSHVLIFESWDSIFYDDERPTQTTSIGRDVYRSMRLINENRNEFAQLLE